MRKIRSQKKKQLGKIRERLIEKVDTSTLTPVFCLHYLESDKHYGLSNCQDDEKVSLIEKLYELSQLTWNQITLANRHGMGLETIPYEEIKGRMPTIITKDQKFVAIRFHQLKPLVGYRNDRIFHVIWLDRNLSLYNHGG